MAKSPLVIISGPSGSGKSTLVRRLLADPPLPLRLSVSATTRPKRDSEVDGQHYHFWTRTQFEQAAQQGKFLEWAEVFGHLYGTLLSEVQSSREVGIGVVLEIDVQGAALVRPKFPDAVSIFLRAGSLDEYKKRLEKRGSETVEAMQKRLAEAAAELQRASEFLYQVVNDDLERALAQVRSILYLEQAVAELRGVWQTQWEKTEYAQ